MPYYPTSTCAILWGMKLGVDRIKDPEQLREVARLLEVENRKLHTRLAKLANRVDKLEGNSAVQLQKEIDGLKRQLARVRREHSSPKSERRKPHRGKRKLDKDKKPQTGGKRTDQPELPHEEETLELDEAERTCSKCGAVAIETEATEDDELIVVVERQFKVNRIKKVKYLLHMRVRRRGGGDRAGTRQGRRRRSLLGALRDAHRRR